MTVCSTCNDLEKVERICVAVADLAKELAVDAPCLATILSVLILKFGSGDAGWIHALADRLTAEIREGSPAAQILTGTHVAD